jgi:hypothetical protein
LSAPAGVFAVLGNHDRWYFAKQIENAITGAGISVLEDAAVSVRSRQCEFWLVGLSDFLTGPRDYRAVLAKLPLHEPALAFTHNPDLFPVVPGNVDLIFAGHTHGGQVYFPGIGRLIVPSRYGQRYAMGHIGKWPPSFRQPRTWHQYPTGTLFGATGSFSRDDSFGVFQASELDRIKRRNRSRTEGRMLIHTQVDMIPDRDDGK